VPSKHKIKFCIIALMLLAAPVVAKSWLESIRRFLSFNIPSEILESVNKNIRGSLRAKNMRFFLPNKIIIDDAEVFDELGEQVLLSPHIEASLSLFSLLTNNITISDARIEEPYFNYKITKSVHNVVRLFDSAFDKRALTKKSQRRVTIAHVRVLNGRFHMMHDVGVEITARNINAEGRFYVEDGPFGIDISQITIQNGSIKIGEIDLPISDLLSSKLWISNEKVATNNLKALYDKAKVTANGSVYIKEDYYDVVAHIKAPQNTYPQGLKPLPFVPPAFDARIELAGALDTPEIKVDAHAGATKIQGLGIDKIGISGIINLHEITLQSCDLALGKNGSLHAQGNIDLKQQRFSLDTSQRHINTSDLLDFFALKLNAQGFINAHTKIKGNFGIKNPEFHIKSKGVINDGLISKIKLTKKTDFDIDAQYVAKSKVVIKQTKISDEQGLKLHGFGQINLPNSSYNFNYDLAAPILSNYLPALEKKFKASQVKSQGSLSGNNKIIKIHGAAAADKLNILDYEANLVELNFDLNNQDLVIPKFRAQVYEGTVIGNLGLRDFSKSQKIEGQASLVNIIIKEPVKNLTSKNIEGLLNGQISFSGSLKNPNLGFDAQFSHLIIDQLTVPHTLINGSYSHDILKLEHLNAEGFLGSVVGQNLSYNIKTSALEGDFYLNDFNVGSWLNNYLKNLEGLVSGPLHVAGTLKSPHISAPLQAKNIKFMAHDLGSGSFSISLRREILAGKKNQEDLVLSVSALLEQENAACQWQSAFALNEKSVNIRAQISNFIFDSSKLSLDNLRFGIKGFLNGTLSAEGPLDELSLDAQLASDDYMFFDPQKRLSSGHITKDLGPATITAVLRNGHLDLDALATLGTKSGGLLLSLGGPCNLQSCDLDLKAVLDHERWENFFPNLQNELARVSAHVALNGKISKRENTPWAVRSSIKLERFLANMPAIPHIMLDQPVSLSYADQKLVFDRPAKFLFSPGDLVVAGSLGPEAMDFRLKGAIPLIFTRLVVPLVQRAEGLAQGELSVSGSLAEPVFDGHIAVIPGSEITFNKWLESLEFKEGAIAFKKTSPNSFRTELRSIKLALGDGRIFINGNLDKKDEIFDLHIEGSNIVIKDKGQFLESDLNLRTIRNTQGQATLKGTIAVIDGLAHRQFDLRNFVARASDKNNFILPKFLESLAMNLDLDIAVRQFRASARMLSIDIDANLTGQLKAYGNINSPHFGGFLSIQEGKITFPAETFDLYESRIDLDEFAQRGFNPKIKIISSQEFEREKFQIQRDTTVQLSLIGDLDQLRLELKPTAGDLKLSQTKIFLMLLLPRSIGASSDDEILRRSAQNAALAFSGEVFLRPLTNELAELLEGKTKTRIQFGSALEPGGVTFRMNWKIGPRIEAQGSYMYISEGSRGLDTERKSFLTDNYFLGDLKLKLILFDHKPFGPLFLESSFGVNRLNENSYEPRGLFRFSYRILSK
jgi:autotransporter translocation and assembly factor TamB